MTQPTEAERKDACPFCGSQLQKLPGAQWFECETFNEPRPMQSETCRLQMIERFVDDECLERAMSAIENNKGDSEILGCARRLMVTLQQIKAIVNGEIET